MRSFKSNENIHKKEGGSYYVVSANKASSVTLKNLSWLGPELFVRCLAHRVQLLVFFCSSVSVVLLDTPGIFRCRSQHVSVESSSLFHHSIHLWFICFPWWSIVELQNLHADRTTVCFEPWQKPRARLGTRKIGLSPPPPQYLNTDRSKVLLLWFLTVTCSCCLYLFFGSAIMLVTYFVNFR